MRARATVTPKRPGPKLPEPQTHRFAQPQGMVGNGLSLPGGGSIHSTHSALMRGARLLGKAATLRQPLMAPTEPLSPALPLTSPNFPSSDSDAASWCSASTTQQSQGGVGGSCEREMMGCSLPRRCSHYGEHLLLLARRWAGRNKEQPDSGQE